jgi:hypothetical protein
MSLALYQLSYFAVVLLIFYRGRPAKGMLACPSIMMPYGKSGQIPFPPQGKIKK